MSRKRRRKRSNNPESTANATQNAQQPQATTQTAESVSQPEAEKVEVIDPNTYEVTYYLNLVPIWSFLTSKLGGYPNESISMQLQCYAYFSDETDDESGTINRKAITNSPAVLSMTVRSVGFDERHPDDPMRHVLIEGAVLASTANNSESKSPELQPKSEFKGTRGYKLFLEGSKVKIICNLDARVGAVVSVQNRKGNYQPYVPHQFGYRETPPPCP